MMIMMLLWSQLLRNGRNYVGKLVVQFDVSPSELRMKKRP